MFRGYVYQALLGGILIALLLWVTQNTVSNLARTGVRAGFDFLAQETGFQVSEHVIPFEASDPYWRAFLVGILNTLRVALVGIALVTPLGFAIGLARTSPNALARGLAYAYVELFRNVPLIVQLFLWYVLAIRFVPEVQEAYQLVPGVWISKAGLTLPLFHLTANSLEVVWPERDGFSFRGGVALTPEYLALVVGLVAYTAAYIAEVVRSGISTVSGGQYEAGASIGLTRFQMMRKVVLPQAMRVIVPPLGNQYLALTKNSSLAVAIGYPDLVSVSSTTVNQTGRALECVSIIIAAYLTLSLLTSLLMNMWNRRVAIKER